MAVVLAGVAALAVYVLPGLPDPAAHWPLWDVRVYQWGGQQAAAGGGALYAPGGPFSFTYPPFAAVLFAAFSGAPAGVAEDRADRGEPGRAAGAVRAGAGRGRGAAAARRSSSRSPRWPC